LLKLGPYKTTAIHALEPRNPASRLNFRSRFLQPVVEGEIVLHLTFFSDETWFHVQVYINMQNNRYWISQNSHLTHEGLLYLVKFCVWCAASARRIVEPVFFNETFNWERYVQVILGKLSAPPVICEL
jgi:hypothetical protein